MPSRLIVLLISFVLSAPGLSHASDNDAQYDRCVKQLVSGNYCLDSQAEIICHMTSMNTVGCAMDMVDMKLAADIFEAVEYCRFPFEQESRPTK